MKRLTTYEAADSQLFKHPQEGQADCVGPEGLPFVRNDDRQGCRIILAVDRSKYEEAGWVIQGTVDNSAVKPMFKVKLG
jgi:hypothetical protein